MHFPPLILTETDLDTHTSYLTNRNKAVSKGFYKSSSTGIFEEEGFLFVLALPKVPHHQVPISRTL